MFILAIKQLHNQLSVPVSGKHEKGGPHFNEEPHSRVRVLGCA